MTRRRTPSGRRTRASSGRRPRGSITTRAGLGPCTRRTVRRGSSPRTVRTPTTTASASARQRWRWRRPSGPETSAGVAVRGGDAAVEGLADLGEEVGRAAAVGGERRVERPGGARLGGQWARGAERRPARRARSADQTSSVTSARCMPDGPRFPDPSEEISVRGASVKAWRWRRRRRGPVGRSGPKAARKRSRKAAIGQTGASGAGSMPGVQPQASRWARRPGGPMRWTGASRPVASPETKGAGWWSPRTTRSVGRAARRAANSATVRRT